MSYQGFGNFSGGPDTVDEVAGYTDMMGQASVMNQAASDKRSWRTDATKSLLALWLLVLITYWGTGFFFRKYIA